METGYRDERVLTWHASTDGLLACSSHLLRDDDGRVWVIDPLDVDGLDDAIHELGTPAGVILLLDRHVRDAPAVAARLGVPLFAPRGHWRRNLARQIPSSVVYYDTAIEGCPFSFIVVEQREHVWLERGLWWPEHHILVVAEAVGSVDYFRSQADDSLGVHPTLRLAPPRALEGLEPELLLVGHGDPVTADAAAALATAVGSSRRSLPRYALWSLVLARAWARAIRDGRSGC